MVNRIKPLLDKIISGNQKVFVEGRHILDAVIVAHKLVHSMENNKRPYMALKLDFSKAYDHVSWNFLLEVLRRFEFKSKFLEMVEQRVFTPKFSILLNGYPKVSKLLLPWTPLHTNSLWMTP